MEEVGGHETGEASCSLGRDRKNGKEVGMYVTRPPLHPRCRGRVSGRGVNLLESEATDELVPPSPHSSPDSRELQGGTTIRAHSRQVTRQMTTRVWEATRGGASGGRSQHRARQAA